MSNTMILGLSIPIIKLVVHLLFIVHVLVRFYCSHFLVLDGIVPCTSARQQHGLFSTWQIYLEVPTRLAFKWGSHLHQYRHHYTCKATTILCSKAIISSSGKWFPTLFEGQWNWTLWFIHIFSNHCGRQSRDIKIGHQCSKHLPPTPLLKGIPTDVMICLEESLGDMQATLLVKSPCSQLGQDGESYRLATSSQKGLGHC